MTIVVVGLNHKTAPVALREQFSFTGSLLPMALGELHLGTSRYREDGLPGCTLRSLGEVVILSTCNRLEIYAVTAGDAYAAWSAIES
jgi:glutamyl-tRNA reductase